MFVFRLPGGAFVKLLDEGVRSGSVWETGSCKGGEKGVW